MHEHDEALARASAGLRAQRSPPPGAEARVLAGLEASFGPAGGGGGGGLAGPRGSIDALWVAKVVGATTAITVTGLATLRALVLVAGLGEPAPTLSRGELGESVTTTPLGERPTTPTRTTPELARGPTTPERASPSDADPLAASPAHMNDPANDSTIAAANEPASVTSSDSVIEADRLAAELALVRAARAEVDPAARLERLDQHARDYPAGKLVDERRALQAIACCELGRMTQAREHLDRLREARPSSPLLDRVAAACPRMSSP